MQPEPRRSTRIRQPSTKYSSDKYVTLTSDGEPQSFAEAMEMKEKEEWIKAMNEEITSLHENHTYDLVELPKGKTTFEEQMGVQVEV